MAAWRYEISLLVLKKYFTRSLRWLVKYFSTHGLRPLIIGQQKIACKYNGRMLKHAFAVEWINQGISDWLRPMQLCSFCIFVLKLLIILNDEARWMMTNISIFKNSVCEKKWNVEFGHQIESVCDMLYKECLVLFICTSSRLKKRGEGEKAGGG